MPSVKAVDDALADANIKAFSILSSKEYLPINVANNVSPEQAVLITLPSGALTDIKIFLSI